MSFLFDRCKLLYNTDLYVCIIEITKCRISTFPYSVKLIKLSDFNAMMCTSYRV